MSAEPPPYSSVYIKAWTLLSVIAAIVFFGMFAVGGHLLNAGHIAWDLLRWICRPII